MHSPFVPGRKQRLEWMAGDLRAARFSIGLAAVLLAIEAAVQLMGRETAVYQLFGLSRQGVDHGRAGQFATYGLIHGGWGHVGLNVLMLVFTGARIERISGWKTAAVVFASGVLAGGVAFVCLVPAGSDWILVGASGGVFAQLLWLTTVSPQSRMWPVPVSARSLGLGLILASGALALCAVWLPLGGPAISHACHFGGALAGWLAGRWSLRWPVSLERLRKERARRESADGP